MDIVAMKREVDEGCYVITNPYILRIKKKLIDT